MKTKSRRFPYLVQFNLTANGIKAERFLGGPVRVLHTVGQWNGRQIIARWFAN